MTDHIDDFTHAMQAVGLTLDKYGVIDDGKIHQCKCPHDKANNKSGRYYLHSDGIANGAFGCYHESDNALANEWKSTAPTPTMSDTERKAYTERMARQQAEREEQTLQEQKDAQTACIELWGRGHDATSAHPYIERKGIRAYGVKVLNGVLLVPMYDGKDNLCNIQFIQADGSKRFKTGAKKKGAYFDFGATDTKAVVICEGFATGASIAQATGHTVVVAFDAGNLLPVAQRIKSNLPDGRRLIIAGDNDAFKPTNTGKDKATACAVAVGAGVVIPDFTGCEITNEPTDFNDLHTLAGLDAVRLQIDGAKDLTPEQVAEVEAVAKKDKPPYKPKPFNQSDNIPNCYVVNDSGVWFVDEKEHSTRICDRLDVVAMTRNNDSEAWGRLLRWRDADGVNHNWAMPIELSYGVGSDVSKELARQGLSIAPTPRAITKLNDYIVGCKPQARAKCVNKTGWHGGVYVLPTETIGQGTDTAIYQSVDGLSNPYAINGTLDEWREGVARLCVDNSRCTFVVSMAFSSVLLPLAQIEGGGVHIVGGSSTGKSTASRLACSVFGKDFLRRWRATDNGLEGVASLHNHSLLVLDELREAPAKDVGNIVYMLANGAGKMRATRGGTGKSAKAWQLLYLSNGEIGLSQHMGEAGKDTHAGQETRFAEVDADAGAGFGIFEALHGFDSGALLSEHIERVTGNLYGVAGREFIRLCAEHKAILDKHLPHDVEAFVNDITTDEHEGQAKRVARRFAIIAIGGELATHWGITGWQYGQAINASAVCFENWINRRGAGNKNAESAKMLEAVKTFILKHADSRFTNIADNSERKTIDRAGWTRTTGGITEYVIIPDVFKKEICHGLDLLATCKLLDGLGAIKTDDNNGKKRYSTTNRIGGIMAKFYVINSRILEHDLQSFDDGEFLQNTENHNPVKNRGNSGNSGNKPRKPTILGALGVTTATESCYHAHNAVVTENADRGNSENPIGRGLQPFVTTLPLLPRQKHDIAKDEKGDVFSDGFIHAHEPILSEKPAENQTQNGAENTPEIEHNIIGLTRRNQFVNDDEKAPALNSETVFNDFANLLESEGVNDN